MRAGHLALQHAFGHFDPGLAQLGKPRAGHPWVRIEQRHHHALDARRHQRGVAGAAGPFVRGAGRAAPCGLPSPSAASV